MSRQSTDEQLRFLLSCVRHSNNGKVDFETVAGECGIVTKGAAAKRYERMMKANNIDLNDNPAAPSSSALPSAPTKKPKKDAKCTGKASAAKKRKLGDIGLDNSSADDEGGATLKPEGRGPTLSLAPKSRRVSRTASVYDKLNLSPTPEDDVKAARNTGKGTENVIRSMFDGTFEVVDANPNWGYGINEASRLEPTLTALQDTYVSFDQFVHLDHSVLGPSSEFESSTTLRQEAGTAVDTHVIETAAGGIFIED